MPARIIKVTIDGRRYEADITIEAEDEIELQLSSQVWESTRIVMPPVIVVSRRVKTAYELTRRV